MLISSKMKNRVRQYLYRPYKSRYAPDSAVKSLKEIDKKIEGGINSLLDAMGYPIEEEKDEEKGEK